MAIYGSTYGRKGGGAAYSANFGGGILANSLGLGDLLKIDTSKKFSQYSINPANASQQYSTGKLKDRVTEAGVVSRDPHNTYGLGQGIGKASWAVADMAVGIATGAKKKTPDIEEEIAGVATPSIDKEIDNWLNTGNDYSPLTADQIETTDNLSNELKLPGIDFMPTKSYTPSVDYEGMRAGSKDSVMERAAELDELNPNSDTEYYKGLLDFYLSGTPKKKNWFQRAGSAIDDYSKGNKKTTSLYDPRRSKYMMQNPYFSLLSNLA